MNHRENLLELRALLLTVSDYDHGMYFHDCDTPSCALGYAAADHIGGLDASQKDDFTRWFINDSRAGPKTAADTVFGEGAYDAIFDITDERAKWQPVDVVAAIDKFLETLPS